MGIERLFVYKKIIFSVVVVIFTIIYRKELDLYFNFSSNEAEYKEGVYSEKKLSQFDGIKQTKLYLAVLGVVFDVTEGKRHYQKGAGYHYFVGKDGSRALVTGNFEDESKNKDHVLDLSCPDLFTLLNWRNTFKKKYVELGTVKGRFYDEYGKETVYAKEFESKLKQCEIEKEKSKQEDLKYPPCNIAWSEEDGTKVWCTNSSGGVKRSWAGVPRQLYAPGVEKPRCICFNDNENSTPPGLIKEYVNCPTSSTCIVETK